MKELSIEQKAQRYDEAIERAKKEKEKSRNLGLLEFIEQIFPELKESEDEKIRKSIIAIISNYVDNSNTFKPKMLAWLEKQGENTHNKELSELLHKVICRFINDSNIPYTEREKVSMEIIPYVERLEKQGEQKPNNQFTPKQADILDKHIDKFLEQKSANKVEPKFKQGDIIKEKETGNLFYVNSVEEFGYTLHYKNCIAKGCTMDFKYEDNYELVEQKTVDKIELKFKVGDIISDGFSEVKITSIEKNNYIVTNDEIKNDAHVCNWVVYFKDQDNWELVEQKPTDKVEPKFKVGDWIIGRATNNEPRQISEITDQYYKSTYGGQYGFSFEDGIHLWTIQDAKDGDILCTYECGEPKIVFILKGTPKKHYALSYHCYYNIMYPHFESDSEKGCLAPNDEDVKPATKEQRDLLFQKMKEAGCEWDADKKELKKIDEIEELFRNSDVEVDSNEDGLIAATIKYKNEQNPAWNEEDEKKRNLLINILNVNHPNEYFKVNPANTLNMEAMHTKELVDWLKSLEYRIVPQQNQEWSEEDEVKDNWEYIQDFIEKLGHFPKDSDELDVLINYVLSKKQKPTWSEEDESLRRRCIGAIDMANLSDYTKDNLLNWFKSLKYRVHPQNKWKESLATADLENSLCDIQDGFSDTSYEYRTLGEAIEFIRCTESKPHWKPSDEQMKMVERSY